MRAETLAEDKAVSDAAEHSRITRELTDKLRLYKFE